MRRRRRRNRGRRQIMEAREAPLVQQTAPSEHPASCTVPGRTTPIVVKQPPAAPWWNRLGVHLVSHRRYFLLMGVAMGLALFGLIHVVYLDQPIPEMMTLSADSMMILRERFSFEWSKRLREELLASIDYRPLLESSDRPGLALRDQNVSAFSPVVMLPGFTSTGLEIWNGSECSRAYFRQRIWGTSRMLQQFVLNQRCWLEHVMLNRSTGLDPEGIKLRPAYGLEAADYVIGGYWVWGKIIENLADIGYDSNNMFMAAYDWRLTPRLLEKRDRYFTKLKYQIEMAKVSNGNRKVVVLAHSYAAQVWFYFMKWVESKHGANAGDQWVHDHIEAYVGIAGSMLGTIKSISALLSGEMKDTAELGGLSRFLEYFFAPSSRASLARSWPSVSTMLPIGGEAIWGNASYAPDDIESRYAAPPEDAGAPMNESTVSDHLRVHGSSGRVLQFSNGSQSNQTAATVRNLLSDLDPYLHGFNDWFENDIVAQDPSLPQYDDPKYWTNPLAASLPKAPNMKVFCLYGVGKPVERGYIYRTNPSAYEFVHAHSQNPIVPFTLHTEYHDLPWIKAGIRYTEGDGTVPLISLGFLCARGWQEDRFNPSRMDVRTREYIHQPVGMLYDPRGGPATSDHVDIMGNHDMIRDILRIAARAYDEVPERIHSNIHDISQRVELRGHASA